jgi:hypothetical protein
MNDNSFIAYVGDPDFHDGTVLVVCPTNDKVHVRIQGASGKIFVAEFERGRIVEANKPEGMLLYALAEFGCEPPFRNFVFANWDEEDDSTLEIVAESLRVYPEE